jgi:hypothetical protein
MWKWIGCEIFETYATPPHILWVKLTSFWVWVELKLPTKKEKWQLSEQAWAHNNCLTRERERERESTLLYPEVAAQIALFTSPLRLQNCQSHSKLQTLNHIPNMLVWAPAIWPKYYIHLMYIHVICHNIITYFL